MEKFLVRKKADPQKTYRCVIEKDGSYFVLAPRKRRYGYRYTKQSFDLLFEIVKPKYTPTEQWHKRIKTVIKRLNKSGLWQDLLPTLNNLLNMTLEDWEAIRDLIWDRMSETDIKARYGTKYPFLFDKNGVGLYNYTSEFFLCKTKSMYFGKHINKEKKEIIKRHLDDRKQYTTREYDNYDITFEYEPEKGKAWYSEEYKGCGNGHYYIALDHSVAMFVEDD